jgi:hypothetical protein
MFVDISVIYVLCDDNLIIKKKCYIDNVNMTL